MCHSTPSRAELHFNISCAAFAVSDIAGAERVKISSHQPRILMTDGSSPLVDPH